MTHHTTPVLTNEFELPVNVDNRLDQNSRPPSSSYPLAYLIGGLNDTCHRPIEFIAIHSFHYRL